MVLILAHDDGAAATVDPVAAAVARSGPAASPRPADPFPLRVPPWSPRFPVLPPWIPAAPPAMFAPRISQASGSPPVTWSYLGPPSGRVAWGVPPQISL